MTSRTTKLLKDLAACDWFSRVGTGEISDVARVKSWDEAIKACVDPRWSNVRIEAANALSTSILKKDRERYMVWNDVADEVKQPADQLVKTKMKKYRKDFALPKEVESHVVSWDVSYMCMESEYQDLIGPGFYSRLAELYLDGYLPCGWKGKYPKGQLIVF